MKFEDVETARQNYLKKRKKISKNTLFVLIPVLTITFMVIAARSSESTFFAAFIPALFFPLTFCFVIYIIVLSIFTSKEFSAYQKSYKSYFVTKSLAKIFTNINYDHLAAMPKENILQVMTTGDRYSSNDYMTATYKKINFAQADVHTENEYTDSDGDTHYSTVFRGRFLIFDFNRNFDFALQVRTKSFPGAILPKNANTNLKFHKLQTESIDFNQDFVIYGQDGVDTFYILEPAFIEKLHNLHHAVKGELAITFLDSKVYIAINNYKDAFEAPNPKKPLDEKSETEKVSKDIEAITTFVDSLNLDKYTYKKGNK